MYIFIRYFPILIRRALYLCGPRGVALLSREVAWKSENCRLRYGQKNGSREKRPDYVWYLLVVFREGQTAALNSYESDRSRGRAAETFPCPLYGNAFTR